MQVIQRKPWDNFIQSCKTEKTRENYVKDLRRFMLHYKIGSVTDEESVKHSIEKMKTECEEILKIGEQELEDTIIDYINSIRHLSEGTIIGRLAAIQKLLESNRVYLKWKYINSFKHSDKKIHRDEAYTREQIELMLKYCSELRMKSIILIFTSTGIRLGGFEGLKLKHLKPIDTEKGKVYEFTIYAGSKEEYITFCTPECSKTIDDYLDYRRRSGEKLTEDSYLIIKQFNFRQSLGKYKYQPVKPISISNLVREILVRSGIRQVNPEGTDKGFRHDTQIDHAFRKWFTSQCTNANLNDTKRYLLEGHSLPNNDNSYVRVKKELLSEYLKAVDLLTIDQSLILAEQNQQLKEEKNEVTLIQLENKKQMSLVLEQLGELQKFRLDTLEKDKKSAQDFISGLKQAIKENLKHERKYGTTLETTKILQDKMPEAEKRKERLIQQITQIKRS